MKCIDIENKLDDYLDLATQRLDGMDDRMAAVITMHIQGCTQCQAELERRQTLLDELRALPVAEPVPGFFEQTVATAVEQNRRRTDSPRRQRYSPALMGLAAALMIALLLGTVTFTGRDAAAPESGLPSITLATNTVTPIKLAFSSKTALTDARLSLSLPVGVELMGYNGRSDLSWITDLEKGTNVLRLPLVGRSQPTAGRSEPWASGTAATDLLIARLEHSTGTKTFRLQVTVNHSGAPQ